jgi:hypothetical protein
VEHAAAPEVLPQVVALIHELVAGHAELERTFAIWIQAALLFRSGGAWVLPEVMSLRELSMTLSNRFEVWAKGHEQRGQEKGFQGVSAGRSAEGRPVEDMQDECRDWIIDFGSLVSLNRSRATVFDRSSMRDTPGPIFRSILDLLKPRC